MICNNCKMEIGNAAVCPHCGTMMLKEPQPHHLPKGTIIAGRYWIDGVLGEGGFGITYLGRDNKLGHMIAIKEYYPQGLTHRYTDGSYEVYVSSLDEDNTFARGRERFLKEAQTLAQFTAEPGVVSVTDYVEENNTAYLIMEYLEGVNLMQYIKQNGTMSADKAFEMFEPVMKTLEKIHAAGVIHRDISPDNIMRLNSGQLVLMDFGSARKFVDDRRTMSVMLKKGYAPMEQYRRSGEQGPWTDVYALCATIYHCITGKLPEDALDRAVEDTLIKPSALGAAISPAQEQVLLYGMAVDHKERCQSMTELLGLLERAKNAGDHAIPAVNKDHNDPNATLFAGEGDFNRPDYNDNYWDPKDSASTEKAPYQSSQAAAPQNSGNICRNPGQNNAYQNPGSAAPYQNQPGYGGAYGNYQSGAKASAPKKKNILVPVLCAILVILLGVFAYEMITIIGKNADKDKKDDKAGSGSSQSAEETEAATAAPLPASLEHVMSRGGVTTQNLDELNCNQLVTVCSNGTKAEIRFYNRAGDTWVGDDSMTCSGYVGDNGVSTDISEHCHRTPKGIFPVGDAFYIGSKPETELDTFEITEDTYWVTDPDSDYYNRRVEGTDNKDWESAEKMITYDDYKRGFVIDFNSDAIYNAGSAIFFRIGSKPTAGGVALSQSDVENYLSSLDSAENPYIIIV